MNQANIFFRFAAVIHYALKKYVNEMANPIHVFNEKWANYYDSQEWIYKDGESWLDLSVLGKMFISKFVIMYENKYLTAILAENKLRNHETGDVFQPDYLGRDGSGHYVVMDYKITDKQVVWADVIGQIFEGALLAKQEFGAAEPIRGVIVNFIKSTGQVEWMEMMITDSQLEVYLASKAEKKDDIFDALEF